MIFIVVYMMLFNFGQTEDNSLFACPNYHNSFGCKFYRNSSLYENQTVPSNNINKPARPTDLQTKFFDNGNITFTWNADTSSIKYLHGFLLNMTLLDGACRKDQSNIFRAFIYTNTSQIEKHKNEQFTIKVKRPCPNIWRLDLYSLPKANCSTNVQHQILVLPYQNRNHSSFGPWLNQIAITYSYPLRNITINFTKASEKFNFEKYKISLQKKNKSIHSKIIDNTSEPFVIFKGDFSEKYNLTIQPFESYPNDINKCFCRIENTCTPCKAVNVIELDLIDPCPESRDSESDSHVVISIIIVSVVAIIIFIILIVKYLMYKSSKKIPKKYAILVCLNDHLLHDKAVSHLIQYLEDLGVVVHYAQDFGKCVFEVFDIVLLINSTALAERQKAWAEEKDYEKFFTEEHSSKLTNETFILIDELSLEKQCHKIISLKFDHVPDSSVFKHYPSQNGNFSIPRNLFGMVKNMVDVSVRFRGFFKRQALLNAIKNAAEYEKSNKNWFSEKYGEPIPESLISSLYSKDKKCIKNNNNSFKHDYSIKSFNVSELLQTLQNKNDQGILLKNLNKNITSDYENNILNV